MKDWKQYLERIHPLATAVAVSVIVSASAAVLQASLFKDSLPDWAKDSIVELNRRGVIRGYNDGRFGPGDPLTRGQVITLLYRLLLDNGTIQEPTACSEQYTDVSADHYAFTPSCSLLQNGWLDASSTLGPSDKMTRGETADIVRRVLKSELKVSDNPDDASSTFIDVSGGHPRARAVAFMNNSGLMTGNPDGSFAMGAPLNRAQVAVILHRALRVLNGEVLPKAKKVRHAAPPAASKGTTDMKVHLIVSDEALDGANIGMIAMSSGNAAALNKAIGRPSAVMSLHPDGKSFAAPVGVVIQMPHIPGSVPLLAHISGDDVEVLDYIVMSYDEDAGTVDLLTAVNHFSDIAAIPVTDEDEDIKEEEQEEYEEEILRSLRNQINALRAQLIELTRLEDSTTFQRLSIDIGLNVTDVSALQEFLRVDSGGDTVSGETAFFGPVTRSGVIKFGDRRDADVLTPLGLTSGTSFVGPVTRSRYQSLAVVLPPPASNTSDEPPRDYTAEWCKDCKEKMERCAELTVEVSDKWQECMGILPESNVECLKEYWEVEEEKEEVCKSTVVCNSSYYKNKCENRDTVVQTEETDTLPEMDRECREIVEECSEIKKECEQISAELRKKKSDCRRSESRDCGERLEDLEDEKDSCEKRYKKCTTRFKYKDCMEDGSLDSDTSTLSRTDTLRLLTQSSKKSDTVQRSSESGSGSTDNIDIRNLRISVPDTTASSSSASSKQSSETDVIIESSQSSSSIADTRASSSSKTFTCCEACPAKDSDRFYFPFDGGGCDPGDVQRDDLNQETCANPLYGDETALPTTYGPSCDVTPVGNFEFLDMNAGWQPVNGLPFGRSVHFIVASDGSHDVRNDLPISIYMWVDNSLQFGLTFGGDPTRACRGADGCSIDGPEIPTNWKNHTVRVEAYNEKGKLLSRYTHRP